MAREKLELVEVSPRDGLQNEPELVSTADKLELIKRILGAGFRRLEAGSFVNPKRVPQMADGDAVFSGLPAGTDATFIALALNPRGVERALAAGAKEINYVFCASDGFSIRNNGATVEETFTVWPQVAALAKAGGARLSATISTAFGCPFDGEVAVARVAEVAAQCASQDIFELALGDTIGVAAPSDVKARFRAVRAATPARIQLRAHFHNTRNTALANAIAAVEEGVRVLDGSLGGIGGCPFAPGAAGNVASEDLLYMFDRMGIDTEAVLEAAGTKWNFLPFRPGLVGGHCIGVDPYYLTAKAESIGCRPEVILAGRRTNDGMAGYAAGQLIKAMIRAGATIRGARVLVMGLTFKENCPDLRNSKVFDLIAALAEYGIAVDAWDPLADPAECEREYGFPPVVCLEAGVYDGIVIAVAHDAITAMGVEAVRALGRSGHLLYDLKYVLPRGAADLRL